MQSVITKEEEKLIGKALSAAYKQTDYQIDLIPVRTTSKKNIKGHLRNILVEEALASYFHSKWGQNKANNYYYTVFSLASSVIFTVEHVPEIGNSHKATLYKKELEMSMTPSLFSEEDLPPQSGLNNKKFAYLMYSGTNRPEGIILKSADGSFDTINIPIDEIEELTKRIIVEKDETQFEPIDVSIAQES